MEHVRNKYSLILVIELSQFELNSHQCVEIWKNACIQKATFWIMLLHKSDHIFCILPAFEKAWFSIKGLTKR